MDIPPFHRERARATMDTAAIWFGVEKDEATASAFALTAHGGRTARWRPHVHCAARFSGQGIGLNFGMRPQPSRRILLVHSRQQVGHVCCLPRPQVQSGRPAFGGHGQRTVMSGTLRQGL